MENDNQKSRVKSGTTKVVVMSLVAGMLGGGIVISGDNAYEAWQQNHISSSSKTTTGNVKVQTTKAESNSATKAFNSVSGAVVSVINLQKSSTNSTLNSIFGSSSSSSSSKKSTLETASEGSGVIFKKSNGIAYIVTNNHVVSGSNALQVIMSDGTKLTAKLVGTDETTDLAVLKINASKVTQIASFGNSNDINVGQTVLAIGSPLGSQYATSVTQGIISAKKRTVAATNDDGVQTGNATVIQTDAAINPGNSGGPLINLSGQVIGINSMKLASDSNGTSVEGMGFSIPSNEVVSIINQIISSGSVKRPALGVTLIDLSNITSSDQKSVLKLPTSITKGVVIMQTLKQSPAKTAGIKKYDVIVAMDGKKVTSQATLREILFSHKIGDSVKVKYYRGSTLKTTTIKLTLDTTTLNKETK
ncbi:serine protease Do [Weissella beninensis]|uniref:Trypsin-like peptidase domain-containing protein n=1 Tax=Periweissella beninensis TaxID=504936 RepID=A0ABT0VHN6_9LACO|nr:trypsin-like peptidase domain-containing protein [Periweissella beninensis]MBM7543349.1 serine protease Do [Periweissella beninensis]MCM2437354.1 trypsin-like peptidase domain-containing protein [Periweissella beninensis]